MNFQLIFISIALHLINGQQYLQPIGTNYDAGDHNRQEVVDANGDIRGQYSYIDPNGQTVSVRYTAGKNGFQVEKDPVALTSTQPQTFPPSNTQGTYIRPGIKYRGLQLTQSKYLAQQQHQQRQLFRPALSATPAATSKQIEAYQKSISDELRTNELSQFDVTPAQFPQTVNNPANNPLKPLRYQSINFYPIEQNPKEVPQVDVRASGNVYTQTASPLISRDLEEYSPTSSIFFEPNKSQLSTIAQNPAPPGYRIQVAQRIATPITEDTGENLVQPQYLNRNNYYVSNFNYK